MTNEISERLAALRIAGGNLNALSTEAYDLVGEIERILNHEIHIGISAEGPVFDRWPMSPECGLKGVHQLSLAFSRIAGKFRIHVVHTEVLDEDDDEPGFVHKRYTQPYEHCSRSIRLKSVASLPGLLDSLLTATDEMTVHATTAVSTAKAIIGGLN